MRDEELDRALAELEETRAVAERARSTRESAGAQGAARARQGHLACLARGRRTGGARQPTLGKSKPNLQDAESEGGGIYL
jgi:hypothetical protein